MTNNYRRNHNLPVERYCGYHKRREKQKERKRFDKYIAPVIEKCVLNIFSPEDNWAMTFVNYK